MTTGGSVLPRPVGVHARCHVWALDIPWLPDLLASGEGSSVTGQPLLESFGRQIAFLRAIASGAPGDTAVQLRFVTSRGDDPEGPVRCQLLGRGRSEFGAEQLAQLVQSALPPEYPRQPVPEAAFESARRPIDTDLLDPERIVEVRRAVESLEPGLDTRSRTWTPVLLPWNWTAQALLSSLGLIRRQPGRCLLGVHVERAEVSEQLAGWLQDEIANFVRLARDAEENPLVLTGRDAYRRWLRQLPVAALRLRTYLAAERPLLPGLAEMVGADLTRTWEAHGPTALGGTFAVHRPRSSGELDRAALLVDELEAHPWDLPSDPRLAELVFLFDPHEANTAFRLPMSPRGGLEGVATKRLSTLGAGREVEVDLGPGRFLIGTRPGGGAVSLGRAEVAQHLLVAGLPGFGKTTTVHSLLAQLAEAGVPFLVVDPAMDDYRQLAAHLEERGTRCPVYRLSAEHPAFNPLAVPDGVSTRVHAGRVLAAFDTALGFTPLWRPGWLLLGRALFEAYEDHEGPGWPTLRDLHRCCAEVVDRAGYSVKEANDIRAALTGRIEFLAAGPAGVALLGGATAGVDWGRLCATPAVIELGDFAGPEERSLVFSLLLAGLVSWREAHRRPGELAHVTVLEEAHRVLSASSGSAGTELFAEAVAELRGAGEGVVVVDQAPSLLHPAVSKFTGSKLVHRVVDIDERRLLGATMLLDDNQHEELARLGPGRLIAYAAGGTAPALVDVPRRTDTTATSTVAVRHTLTDQPRVDALWCAGCQVRCKGRAGQRHHDALWDQVCSLPVANTREGAMADGALVAEAASPLTAGERLPSASAYCLSASVLGRRYERTPVRLRTALTAASDALDPRSGSGRQEPA